MKRAEHSARHLLLNINIICPENVKLSIGSLTEQLHCMLIRKHWTLAVTYAIAVG